MRIRRHTGSGTGRDETEDITGGPAEKSRGDPWKRFGRDMGLVALVALVGYLLSGYWISPWAVFASEHAVPRVLDLSVADARERLGELGFRVRVDGERPNPVAAQGTVVWQDPTAPCSWC